MADEVLFAFEEEEESEFDEQEVDPEKLARREKEKEVLIERLNADDHFHLITRVAHLLNRFQSTRNSDITLMIKYWEIYESKNYKEGQAVTPEQLYEFERLTSLARARAKIQNEFGLFKGEEKVRRFRKSKEEVEKEIQLSTKPDIPTINIYCDETGKNKNFAIVGSYWVLERSKNENLIRVMSEWKREKGLTVKNEFHFTEMKKHQYDLYVEFFNKVVEMGEMVSFQAIAFDMRENRRKIDDLLSDLHYQLVHMGIEHETATGRVSLPRSVNFTKDKEVGNDALTLVKIEQNLQLQFKVNYEDKLRLNLFGATESYASVQLQIADLFAGSLNRLLNDRGENYKDDFALHVFRSLGMDPENIFSSESDMVRLHLLQ
ncbi:hypothetical protein FHS16_004566 [Paenibacillus endophyticus]|uniref:DUF3800 domain-containing protein n=1 Tax=Paenibacillus endophyticus TaxID=1294268 RepID=A0A7W5CC89_9BACL|nr:DUF3800 domain-containing protein [Paenibacillus endophyticus]MBB3154484.1 hypothetical protein [Paenibacillus endophyticus]